MNPTGYRSDPVRLSQGSNQGPPHVARHASNPSAHVPVCAGEL